MMKFLMGLNESYKSREKWYKIQKTKERDLEDLSQQSLEIWGHRERSQVNDVNSEREGGHREWSR